MRKREVNSIRKTKQKNPKKAYDFLNPAGTKSFHPTREEAERARKKWKPQITQLYSMGIIKPGHRLELVFSGYDKTISLDVKGVNGSSMVFRNPRGGVVKLIEIRKMIERKTGKSPVLDCKKTIHEQTKKSLEDLKSLCKNSTKQRYPDKDPEQLNLLEIFDGPLEEVETEVCESSPSMDILPLDDFAEFKDDFDTYSNNQANFINSIDRFSNEDKKTLWKKNLINMLSLNV